MIGEVQLVAKYKHSKNISQSQWRAKEKQSYDHWAHISYFLFLGFGGISLENIYNEKNKI
jgi:hypothetical protein